MREYDVILFDLVGVLVDTSPETDAVFLSWTGLSEADLWARWLRSPAVRDFDTGRISTSDFASRLIGELNLPVDPDEFIEVFKSWLKGLNLGVKPLLARLSQTYQIACLSNINELHWPQIRDEFGIDGLFHHYFLSHEMGTLKPDVSVFKKVLETLNMSPERIVFFDDNQPNVEGAQKLGIQAYRTKGFNALQQKLTELNILT